MIRILSNSKAPYNVSALTADVALTALSPASLSAVRTKIESMKQLRTALLRSLGQLREDGLGVGRPLTQPDANFILVPILARTPPESPDNVRAKRVYLALAEPSDPKEPVVVVRFRGDEVGCKACLRITVGTEEENKVLVRRLREVLAEDLGPGKSGVS